MWKWGPIIWGLLSFVGGLAVGLVIKYLLNKNSLKESFRCNTEVVFIIDCKPDEVKTVEAVLYNHLAIGIGRMRYRGDTALSNRCAIAEMTRLLNQARIGNGLEHGFGS